MMHLDALWDMPSLSADIDDLLEWLPSRIEHDRQYDIIGGAAGCIATMLSLYRWRQREPALAVAVQCGDWLLANAQSMEQGIAWPFNVGKSKPLTGYAHGAAGAAAALLELASATGLERFRSAGIAAIAYERSLYSAEAGNWPDLRDPEIAGLALVDGKTPCGTAWCHGAPGIGLGRLQVLPLLDEPAVRDEIAIAVQTTLSYGASPNHCLCHGALGNLALMVEAGHRLDRADWLAQAEERAAGTLESIAAHGWLCGVPMGVETPDLMTGIGGIGYGCLRLAEPERAPLVLLLEGPPGKF
jgi:lantibiotic modifying enzyme